MPAPVNKSADAAKETGHAAGRVAWESKRDGDIFDFDYVDYDPAWFTSRDTKVMAKELGRGDAEKAFPRIKYKYLRDELVTLQGWDGYALDIEGEEGGQVMMRTYIVKDRLYRMLVTAKGDMKTRSAAVRFVDSLRLADAGNEVSVLARGKHLEAIQAKGLTLLAGDKKIVAKVRASDRPADLGPQDVVISTLKASSLGDLAAAVGPLLGKETPVVFAQNGIPWWYGHGLTKSRPAAPDLSRL